MTGGPLGTRMWYWELGKVDFDLLKAIQDSKDGNVALMQYTGLKDKNGKEIYCSDIIKEKTKWRQAIYIVTWRTDLACFVISNSTDKKNWYPLFSRSDIETPRCSFIEIIGDIYSNPDLLNNKEGA